jgi:glutamate 5-kinase
VKGGFDVDAGDLHGGVDGRAFAKGLTRFDAAGLRSVLGTRTDDLPEGSPHEVIHRDDLVVLP